VLGAEGESILVTANFIVHRMRYESVDAYIGHYDYKLLRVGEVLKIHERRAILDNEALRPHGKISFIL
ncbi:MAG TPA: aromatic-ring-hydroxylating dioxygenase subunit beta, partial [Candidatus Binataceae bacterium]|nr:aromatic-ring-hydroxylating dioxygenase subunit beta [Candidatus Binataceae bacterium]